jgi:hypothetical protein
MKKTITSTSNPTPTFTFTGQPRVNHYEPFINAQQAAVALNLPLYYFVNTYKQAKMCVFQVRRSISSHSSVAKKLSAIALS